MFSPKKHKKIDFLKAHERLDDLVASLHLHRRKSRGNFFLTFLKGLAVFILIIVILGGVTAGILFFKFKGYYDLAVFGKASLESSISSGQQKDFNGMAENSLAAENSFAQLAIELEALRNNFIFKNLPFGQQELADIDYIIMSAGIVSRALNESAVIGDKFNGLLGGKFGASFSEFSPEQKKALLKFIYESGPELNGAKADLQLALLTMNKVDGGGLLSPFKGKINEAKAKLEQASTLLSQAVLASELAPGFFGYPKQSTFLVLFQNNDELRPTGGFLGTYGILQTSNGDIVRFDSHDIYHMDQPMEAGHLMSIVPPDPIKKYLNKSWYMRDSNWSPDWPTSAAQIVWFYNKENVLLPPKNQINNFTGDFTGVIAITPEFVESLLNLTGPLSVNGEQFNQDNFTTLLQYKVEQDLAAQNVTSWQRKEIIGKILEELKKKLFNLNYGQWPAALEKVTAAIAQKDILVSLKDDYAEGLVKELGMGGEIKTVDGDYLMLVDSNMAALKTDAVMQRDIVYKLTAKADGLYADLNIAYANKGTKDWRTDDYKSYTRIYLPKGSELLKAEGFVYEPAKSYDEGGKTVVAGFLIVRLGKTVNLHLQYKLPQDLTDNFQAGAYNLYWQKQPGNRVKSIKVDVTAADAIKSYNPAASAQVRGNEIIWSSALDTDKEFKVIF